MQQSSMNIQLYEDGAYVELTSRRVKHTRHITIPELISCICYSIGQKYEEEKVMTPILPHGTIGYVANLGDREKYTLYMFQPGYRGKALYETRVFEDVGLPSAVFAFRVEGKVLISTYTWAVLSNVKICRPDIPLYHYPIYNVDGSGHLCMGPNRISINEPWELFKAPEIIRSMPFSKAYNSRHNSGLEGDSLLKSLQGKEFPDEWLTPANITLGKIMER